MYSPGFLPVKPSLLCKGLLLWHTPLTHLGFLSGRRRPRRIFLTIPGYELIEELTRNDLHDLQRGRSRKDKRPVLMKVPHRQPPNHTDIELLEREFQILKDLSVAGVLRPYEMFRMNGRCCLVLEDRGGAPLRSLRGSRRQSVAFFFRIGVQLWPILADLHRRQVGHRALNAQGTLLFPPTGEVPR